MAPKPTTLVLMIVLDSSAYSRPLHVVVVDCRSLSLSLSLSLFFEEDLPALFSLL